MILKDRDPVGVRERLVETASRRFAGWEARGQWKKPEQLLASFRRQLEKSGLVDELLARKELSDEVLQAIFQNLLLLFDDESVMAVPAPGRRDALREAQDLAQKLTRQAETLESARCILEGWRTPPEEFESPEVLECLSAYAERARSAAAYWRGCQAQLEQEAPPGTPMLRPPGRLKEPSTMLAERVEEILLASKALLPKESRAFAVRLAAEFSPLVSEEKLRDRLRDRDRRAQEKPSQERTSGEFRLSESLSQSPPVWPQPVGLFRASGEAAAEEERDDPPEATPQPDSE